MKVNCRPYKSTLDSVAHQMHRGEPSFAVAMIASTTHIPAIVVCAYMIKFLFPENVDLRDTYEGLVKFYQYTEVTDFE